MQNASEGRGKSLEFYFAFGATHEFSDQNVTESSFLKDRPVRAGLVFRKLLNY